MAAETGRAHTRRVDHTQHARAIAATVAARGVALTGSVAAGTDHPDSDIDLIALTDTSRDIEIRSVEGRMVTIGWKRLDQIEAAFTRPWEAGVAVPTWRAACLLTDPEGLLARVKDTAEAWDWADIAGEADRWAAAGVLGLAEEVHKVCGLLDAGNTRAAAANRSILALQLPGLLAAAGRLLYRTENELWDLVCQNEGRAWTSAWDTACGLTPTDLAASCRASLRLYRIAAARTGRALDEAQRPVVDTACRLAVRHGALAVEQPPCVVHRRPLIPRQMRRQGDQRHRQALPIAPQFGEGQRPAHRHRPVVIVAPGLLLGLDQLQGLLGVLGLPQRRRHLDRRPPAPHPVQARRQRPPVVVDRLDRPPGRIVRAAELEQRHRVRGALIGQRPHRLDERARLDLVEGLPQGGAPPLPVR